MAWKKGESGNPRGRPRGSINFAKLRKAIADDLPEIIDAMMTAAKAGDVQAAKLLLDRCLPPLKPSTGEVIGLSLSGEPTQVHGRLLEAVSNGSMPVSTALDLARLLGLAPESAEDRSFPALEKLDEIYRAALEKMERDQARVNEEIKCGKRGAQKP